MDITNQIKTIEVLGVPGTGKTFFIKQLVKLCGFRQIAPFKQICGSAKLRTRLQGSGLGFLFPVLPSSLHRRWAKKMYKVRFRKEDNLALQEFVAQNSAFFDYTFSKVLHCKRSAIERIQLLHSFKRLLMDYQFAKSNMNSSGAIIFDESFAQKAVSLALHLGFDVQEIREYITKTPQPDLLTVVDASMDTVYRRLQSRGWPGWMYLPSEAAKSRMLDISICVVEEAVDAYSRSGVQVIRILNNGGPKEMQEQCKEFMERTFV